MSAPDDNLTPKARPAFSSAKPPTPPVSTTAGMAGDSDDFSQSHLYKVFLKEREQIEKFRISESAKVGHDIGFEKALLTWIIQHREEWRKKNS